MSKVQEIEKKIINKIEQLKNFEDQVNPTIPKILELPRSEVHLRLLDQFKVSLS